MNTEKTIDDLSKNTKKLKDEQATPYCVPYSTVFNQLNNSHGFVIQNPDDASVVNK